MRRRLVKGEEEIRLGRRLARENVVVNDQVAQAVAQVAGIVEGTGAPHGALRLCPAAPGPGDLAEDA